MRSESGRLLARRSFLASLGTAPLAACTSPRSALAPGSSLETDRVRSLWTQTKVYTGPSTGVAFAGGLGLLFVVGGNGLTYVTTANGNVMTRRVANKEFTSVSYDARSGKVYCADRLTGCA